MSKLPIVQNNKEKIKRKKTPSFILELPLQVSPKQSKELLSRLESARQLYNALLGEAKKRAMLIRQSKLFQQAKNLPPKHKDRNVTFERARSKYDFNEYSLHEYIGKLRHSLPNNLDIHTTQKLATRAFRSAERLLFGIAKKVRFKGYNQLNSVESKSNVTGIRWREGQVIWNKLILKPIIKIDDEVIQHGLKCRVKYCRLVKKIYKGRNLFYVQLILEGKPLIKEKNKLGKGTVCFDIGPSTVGIVAKDENDNFQARLVLFCEELKSREKEIRRLQREIDRQRRQNNPNNYLPDGRIKRGKKTWKKSKRQLANENKLKEVYRVTASYRKSLQGKLANETIRMGNVFKTENFSLKWLQKLYGKSVGMRAPGKYVSEVKRKAENAGGSLMKFSTQSTKLSQTCVCGRQEKKQLSDRVHDCSCGVLAQRDLFTSFLGIFVEEVEKEKEYILQAAKAKELWPSADKPLQTAWRIAVESTIGGRIPFSFGKPQASRSQSRSFAKWGRAKFEVQDDVLALAGKESLKENKVFPSEPTGIYSP